MTTPQEYDENGEQEKADRALDWIDAEADKWAVEVKLPEIIKNLSAITTLSRKAPDDVRANFRARLEQNIDALVRQTFLEAWLRAQDMVKERSTTLRDERDAAVEALRPFADAAKLYDLPLSNPEVRDDLKLMTWHGRKEIITVGDLRRAASLASRKPAL